MEAALNWQIVLFYQYCDINESEAISEEQSSLCTKLNLKGRIRISPEGINGTLQGSVRAIEEYIDVVDSHVVIGSRLKPIHWKFSGPVDRYPLENQLFKSLSVKVVKEVVSLDLPPTVTNEMIEVGTGVHLTPHEFHGMLKAYVEGDSSQSDQEVVLIDVRNSYETRIGKFICEGDSKRLEATDPLTRQFSDFARFVDEKADALAGKKVMMYCTGGVRCERASAYVKLKGVTDVFQLSGGIHAYMETYPDGGYFKGKNFVFDPRIALPSKDNNEVVGKCLLCCELYDDYAPQFRCTQCRILVLVCPTCASSSTEKELLCEQCIKRS